MTLFLVLEVQHNLVYFASVTFAADIWECVSRPQCHFPLISVVMGSHSTAGMM